MLLDAPTSDVAPSRPVGFIAFVVVHDGIQALLLVTGTLIMAFLSRESFVLSVSVLVSMLYQGIAFFVMRNIDMRFDLVLRNYDTLDNLELIMTFDHHPCLIDLSWCNHGLFSTKAGIWQRN